MMQYFQKFSFLSSEYMRIIGVCIAQLAYSIDIISPSYDCWEGEKCMQNDPNAQSSTFIQD